ncbi:hypothetical protein TWF506_008795 [Arthrobotrys conoides]|uniref:Uncharacterized protein n=1 Tax=Arthrobotrys conoides TaxID=74498 RepID=A0AAN8RXR0_9PEZI
MILHFILGIPVYDYKIRDPPAIDPSSPPPEDNPKILSAFTDSELEKVLKCHDPAESYRFYVTGQLRHISAISLKAIFAEHDLNAKLLQPTINFLDPLDTPVGNRSSYDKKGAPKTYDLYFILPSRIVARPWESLKKEVVGMPLINTRVYLEIFAQSTPTEKMVLSDTSDLKLNFKYDLKTKKSTVLLQTGASRHEYFPLLRDAFVSVKRRNGVDQKDPFFIIILILRNWMSIWRRNLEYIGMNTGWLDEKVQDFILADSNEVENEYRDLNAKLHITQRHVSRMRSEILRSSLVFKSVNEQHQNFLDFSGLKSEASVKVREQLTGLLVDIQTLDILLEQESDKIKTSTAWLSASISLKHTKAMRVASEESKKASLALKENTDAMKANDDLLRELAQETLESNKEVKKNGDAMRQIAEESKKIAEANSKESETMTQIAVSTQKDGQSMKVLAFLTMLYLPGAFVSSIFGWSIISFDVSDDGSQQLVVAKQWWLFVISTLALTIATMLGCLLWIWFSQKKLTISKAKIDRVMEDEDEAEKSVP